MAAIGFRCWKDKYSYVIVEGTQDNVERKASNHVRFPGSMSRPEQLAWFRKEIKELFDTNEIDAAIYKATENNSRTKDMARGQVEGVLQEVIFSHATKANVEGRVKNQLTSKTTSRKPKYLGELIDIEAFEGLGKGNFDEACIAALSGLPK